MELSEEILSLLFDEALSRFLNYVTIDTTSSSTSGTHPSSEGQLRLGKLMVSELKELHLENVEQDENGYIYADLPATAGYENVQAIGFLAHLDTSNATSGANIEPRVIENYDGSPITFPKDANLILTKEECPELNDLIGHDLITSSGDTLLGADDKAGIAEIMAALAVWVKYPELPHGPITICFTPDEEIGEGTDFIKMDRMAPICYTFDGGEMGELETECFDAWGAKVVFKGVSAHPGYAKDKMVNAIRLAASFVSQLPEGETPERTEKREGFYHCMNFKGSEELAEALFILRDFDVQENKRRMSFMESLKEKMMAEYPGLEIELTFTHQYENMNVYLKDKPKIKEIAANAIENAGLEVKDTAIRGGTDGARLSAKGIPTPNLFAGGIMFHSRREFISTKALQKAAEVCVRIAFEWTK
ncbi:MAG: peptidase T [Candidatus Heimdallarchaeota archaeon]|nr:peptidase T [Candidatus Heimdallarchaeota archaeon]MCK5049135.1 peptidase T [Candidatus Heimdallarchaeota archaeon]